MGGGIEPPPCLNNMKTNQPGNHDDPLHKVLQEWHPDVSLPPRFQEQVWRRIERAQAPSVWAAVSHWIETVLPRPALAASYVAMLLVVGVTAGWAQAHLETTHVRDELGQRYVRVLDPYQTPRE
jgi:hypothetical protein